MRHGLVEISFGPPLSNPTGPPRWNTPPPVDGYLVLSFNMFLGAYACVHARVVLKVELNFRLNCFIFLCVFICVCSCSHA
jgi:hypothetical protein